MKNNNIAILMATYNGEKFLTEQLHSFINQTHQNWELHVSDDGSSDQTLEILNDYKAKTAQNVFIYQGPHQGFCSNFLSLINCVTKADFYAFSDQDDIWEKDKLERAYHWINHIPSDIPALYCTRTCLIDEKNNILGYSTLFSKKLTFANALVQSLAGGNTMVFNQAALARLKQMTTQGKVVSHDWWTYLVVTGCGGQVFYDPYPSLRYRQHTHNLVGMNTTVSGKLLRIKKLMEGRFKEWNEENITILLQCRGLLTPDNQIILDKFVKARYQMLFARVYGFLKAGIYRQTLLGNMGLVVAALFKKI